MVEPTQISQNFFYKKNPGFQSKSVYQIQLLIYKQPQPPKEKFVHLPMPVSLRPQAAKIKKNK